MAVGDNIIDSSTDSSTDNEVSSTVSSTDCISRQAVIDIIHRFFTEEVDKIPTKKTEDGEVLIMCKAQPLFEMNKAICKRIKALPSVPTERTGHWEWLTEDKYRCSICNSETRVDECLNEPMYEFCPYCGKRLAESEDKE